VELLDEALRALASGGAILFETPNPDNVLVGSRNFYLDPPNATRCPRSCP
jgi:O-antigen chain-terminating methyltransferase